MPIYEYYCPDNHRIYQFYAKTLAQAQQTPPCPDNPAYRMERIVSGFSIGGATRKSREGAASDDAETGREPGGEAADALPHEDPADPRMEAALSEIEGSLDGIDENDPRQMARVLRRMAEAGGEPLDEQMEEVVRKLEEGADPDSLEEAWGSEASGDPAEESRPGEYGSPALRRRPRGAPTRDPQLYDY